MQLVKLVLRNKVKNNNTTKSLTLLDSLVSFIDIETDIRVVNNIRLTILLVSHRIAADIRLRNCHRTLVTILMNKLNIAYLWLEIAIIHLARRIVGCEACLHVIHTVKTLHNERGMHILYVVHKLVTSRSCYATPIDRSLIRIIDESLDLLIIIYSIRINILNR